MDSLHAPNPDTPPHLITGDADQEIATSQYLSYTQAVDVVVNDSRITIQVAAESSIAAPLAWFPRLLAASQQERDNWTLVDNGEGILWPDIDESISTESLVEGPQAQVEESPLPQWPQWLNGPKETAASNRQPH